MLFPPPLCFWFKAQAQTGLKPLCSVQVPQKAGRGERVVVAAWDGGQDFNHLHQSSLSHIHFSHMTSNVNCCVMRIFPGLGHFTHEGKPCEFTSGHFHVLQLPIDPSCGSGHTAPAVRDRGAGPCSCLLKSHPSPTCSWRAINRPEHFHQRNAK